MARPSLEIFVACAPGLEPLLLEEVVALGAQGARTTAGGVTLEGDLPLVYRANLELGLASHVLLRVGSFRAIHFTELVRRAARLPWESFLDPSAPLTVRATAKKSKLRHTGALAERVRRAVAERLRTDPPEPSGDEAEVRILVRMQDDQCTLSLDTSGEPLHRRGYRRLPGRAPLREDLARALLRVSGWDPATPLADPFAGAGTIPVEAALLARRLPPGRLRSFAFERFPSFDARAFARVREEALSRALPRAPAALWGSDRDPAAVEAARENAERAGVLEDLTLTQAPLRRAPFLGTDLPERGALVTDPPHGRRLGDRQRLRTLYRSLGTVAKGLPPGWHFALVASDRRLALASGLPLETALLTDSGGTKIRMLRTEGRLDG